MFTSIKSLEIIKQIFSFVYRKHILRFINYNKSLQSKLSINLDTYKNNAKVYRVIENNGQGKEYDIDTDELLFEGEYKNKKRNGIGKEYDEEKLIFEGEYKNGIKNGHGKKYDKNGKLIFEGQYLNGVEWEGKGMIEEEAEDVGLLRITLAYYYGEFKEGKINGQGKKINTIYSKDKNDYEGNFLKGKKNGQGKEYYDLNNMKILLYEGEFKDDKRNGYGKEYKNGKIIFEGQFLNGQRWEGYGKEYNNKINDDKVDFEGEYKNGKRNGKGKEYFNDYTIKLFGNDFNENTIKFEGNYLDGHREGEGIEYFENGKIKFKGEFTKGKRKNGKGYNIKGEVVYEIKDGEGNIKQYDFRDKIEFEGEYKNYQYWNGKRSIYNKNGNINLELFYTEGKINLKKEYDNKGELIFELICENNKKKGKEYKNGELIFEGEYKSKDELKMQEAIDYAVQLIFGDLTLKSNLKRWNGKGKEFNGDDKLIYEGEFLNGEKHGKGKIT